MTFLRFLACVSLCGCFSSVVELDDTVGCQSEHVTLRSELGHHELVITPNSPGLRCVVDGVTSDSCFSGHGTLFFDIPDVGFASFDRFACVGEIQIDEDSIMLIAHDSVSALAAERK